MGHQINGVDFLAGPREGFLTWHERPVNAADYQCESLALAQPAEAVRTAIVMQGALVAEMDFTLQTLVLYRRLYPQATLILSTWLDADPALLDRARQLDVQIVQSAKPAFAGQQNINLQIVTSAAGVLAAQAGGATHILKTRTDQRLCAANLPDYLHGLQQSFPLRGASQQQARLLAVSLNTFRYRMYGISDMFLYGTADDMVRYWTPPLDTRVFDPDLRYFTNLREFAQWRVCEVYLCTEFLQRIGVAPAWTLQDYWRLMAERFCIVDAASLDLFWPKYTTREQRWNKYDKSTLTHTELDFRSWMLLFSGLDRVEHYPEERLG